MTEPSPAAAPPRGTPNLNKALAQFQAEMPTLERDRTVAVETKGDKPNYGYSYATLANVTRHALPLLGKHGLSFTAFPGIGSDGKMAVRYSLLHSSGEERTGEFPLSAEGGIQVLGGRITYIRRYCLLAVTGLAADEDDDAAAAQAEDEANAGTARRATTPKPRPRREAPAEPSGEAVQRKPPAAAPPLPGETDPADTSIPRSMMTKLHASLNDVGVTDRDERLITIGELIGRKISTAHDMTRDEVISVIDAIEWAKAGKGETGDAAVDWTKLYRPRGQSRTPPDAPARSRTARDALAIDQPPSDEPAPFDRPATADPQGA